MTSSQTRFNVVDYGAAAGDGADAAPAFALALAAAAKRGGATVFVPAGRYTLETALGRGMIEIADADGLTLEGEAGTLLISSDPQKHMVHIARSRNIVVRRMEMDRNPLVFTQGKIDSLDPAKNQVTVTIDPGYDEPDAPYLAALTGLHIWTDPKSHAYDQTEWGPAIMARERISPRRWRLTLNQTPRPSYQGMKFFLWDNIYKGWGVVCTRSEDVLVEDIRYYAGGADAGMAVWGCSGDITYRRFMTGIPPGSDRLFAAGGGSQQFNNQATVTLDDCECSNVDDDGVNMGTIFCRVLRQIDPQTIVVENSGELFGIAVPFQVGDTISLWDWDLKKQRSEAIILATATVEDECAVRLSLDAKMSVLHPVGSPGLPEREGWTGAGRFEQFDGIDRIASFEAAGTLIVRNCRFQNMRARNILIKTSNSIIENSTFYDTNMASIIVGPEFFWGEAPAVRNLVIRNNHFRNIGGSSIDIGCYFSDSSYDNRNILIEGNTFEGYGQLRTVNQAGCQGTAVRIRNADGVVLRGNTFGPASPMAPADARPVVVEVSRNVTFENNIGLDGYLQALPDTA